MEQGQIPPIDQSTVDVIGVVARSHAHIDQVAPLQLHGRFATTSPATVFFSGAINLFNQVQYDDGTPKRVDTWEQFTAYVSSGREVSISFDPKREIQALRERMHESGEFAALQELSLRYLIDTQTTNTQNLFAALKVLTTEITENPRGDKPSKLNPQQLTELINITNAYGVESLSQNLQRLRGLMLGLTVEITYSGSEYRFIIPSAGQVVFITPNDSRALGIEIQEFGDNTPEHVQVSVNRRRADLNPSSNRMGANASASPIIVGPETHFQPSSFPFTNIRPDFAPRRGHFDMEITFNGLYFRASLLYPQLPKDITYHPTPARDRASLRNQRILENAFRALVHAINNDHRYPFGSGIEDTFLNYLDFLNIAPPSNQEEFEGALRRLRASTIEHDIPISSESLDALAEKITGAYLKIGFDAADRGVNKSFHRRRGRTYPTTRRSIARR